MKRRALIRLGLTAGAAGVLVPGAVNPSLFGPGTRTAHAQEPTQGEFDELRTRWRDMLTGGDIDPADPDVSAALTRLDEEAGPFAATLIRDPDRTDLWADLPLPGVSSGTSHLNDSYQRLRTLATAWATPGAELYDDADLVTDIVQALDLLNRLYYNEGGDITGNWWHWEIGIPRRLVDTCTLVYQHIPADQLAAQMRAVDRYCPNPDRRTYSPSVAETGANRTDKCVIVAMRGILGRDESKIVLARDGLSDVRDNGRNSLFKYVTGGDGFYEDGSFIQHRYIAYTGTYGNVLLSGVADMTALLGNSSWPITDPGRSVIYDAVERSFAPVIFDLLLMDCMSGRAISRQRATDNGRGRSTALATLLLATGVTDDYADRWRRMVKGWVTRNPLGSFYDGLSLPAISRAKEVLDDSTIEPGPRTAGSFVFADMDRIVHRRPEWAYAISMSSSRISRNESANGENRHGWYIGEGMTYLYGEDFAQYNDAFWPTVDAYRMPGTTVGSHRRADLNGGYYPRPPTPWAGGAVLDASYTAAGMELIGEEVRLEGRKAWFCLDDAVVALGAGITGSPDHPVQPTADARVNAGTSADVNYRSVSTLLVKKAGENQTRESFLTFDISEVPESVATAELMIWARVNDGGGTEFDVDVHAVNGAWDEGTITWNTKPAMGSRLNSVHIDSTWRWHAVDVSAYVADRHRAGASRTGFGLRQSPPSGTNGLSVEIASRESNDHRPYLRLTLGRDQQLPPTADARVNAGTSADVNYGSHSRLLVKKATPNLTRESFVAFDISDPPSTLVSAELVFWGRVNDSGGSAIDVDVHAVNDAWDENTITWNTKPAMGSRLDSVDIDSTWRWRTADVTGYIQERAQAGADRAGFGLRQTPRSGTDGLSVEIASREDADHPPYLRLTLSEPTTTVETIVENRNLHADGDNALVIDGTTTPSTPDWQEHYPSAGWAHLSGTGGYVFPGGAALNAARLARTGAWSDISTGTDPGDPTPITRRYVTLWHDHGSNPSDETYAYILLPGATAAATEQYAADSPVDVLANTAAVQAIGVGRLGLVSAILWDGGTVDIDDSALSSDGPAAIVLRQDAGEIRVAVSDPSRTADTLTVTLPYPASRVISADPTVTLVSGTGRARLRIAVGGSRGHSHAAVLAIDSRG